MHNIQCWLLYISFSMCIPFNNMTVTAFTREGALNDLHSSVALLALRPEALSMAEKRDGGWGLQGFKLE